MQIVTSLISDHCYSTHTLGFGLKLGKSKGTIVFEPFWRRSVGSPNLLSGPLGPQGESNLFRGAQKSYSNKDGGLESLLFFQKNTIKIALVGKQTFKFKSQN